MTYGLFAKGLPELHSLATMADRAGAETLAARVRREIDRRAAAPRVVAVQVRDAA